MKSKQSKQKNKIERFRYLVGDAIVKMQEIGKMSVDAVITDPPYCSGAFNESGKMAAKAQGVRPNEIQWFDSDNMTTAGLMWLVRLLGLEAYRVLKRDTSFLMFADWRMSVNLAPVIESCGFQFRNIIVWNKGHYGMGNGFRPQHEFILHFVKGKGTFYDKSIGNVITVKRLMPSKKIHLTEKPPELIGKLVKVVTDPGMTVLDPFAGSAVTGEVCVKLDRDCILIDKSEFHYLRGDKRLRRAIKKENESLFSKTERGETE